MIDEQNLTPEQQAEIDRQHAADVAWAELIKQDEVIEEQE